MPNIDMTEAIILSEGDEFWQVRGKAIQAYANLEQSIAHMFSSLSETPIEVAVIILFRIASSDARNKIVEKLFRRRLNDAHNLFRNSLFSQLKPLDRERNEIVHWNAVCKMGHDGRKTTAEVLLAPAAFLSMKPPPFKNTNDLRLFIKKCHFYSRLISMFTITVLNPNPYIPEDERLSWLKIFSEGITYPPSPDHPLFPSPKALDGHIESFFV